MREVERRTPDGGCRTHLAFCLSPFASRLSRLAAPLFLLALMLNLAAGALPSIADTLVIRDWVLCGPFAIGPREGITGTAEDPTGFRLAEGDSFRSSLVQGGVVTARRLQSDSLGWLVTDYQNVRWDSIVRYYGIAGIVCAGYAYAEFECEAACCALAVATKLGSFVLNGRNYLGDIYGNGWFRTPVLLDSGKNRVLLRVSGYGDERVRFLFLPVSAPVSIVVQDATVPDLLADEPLAAWCGIPLVNNTPDPVTRLRVRLTLTNDSCVAETVVCGLPGFGVTKVPIFVQLPPMPFDSVGLSVAISVAPDDSQFVSDWPGHHIACDTLRLLFRRPDQPLRQTFISALDLSCQYYAVIYPREFDRSRRYPVVFTLHGAGVEAWDQANAYRQKDWAFIVAPTNRRPYGFDWQDWGRLDAIEVLDTVLARLPIDPNRVLLCGGSMGGHGCWHVGLSHPDRFAALGPQASWPTHQLYVPWFLQRSAIFAQPGQLAVRDAVLRSDNVPALLGNGLNLPVFIVHGGDDDNVPTLHGRNFALWLDELGQDYAYREVPNRKHWWTDESLGITVADDTALMGFIKDKHRVRTPRHVRFRSADLGTSHRAYWVSIERVLTVGKDAAIEAWVDDSLVRVNTENIARLRLHLDGLPVSAPSVRIEIDGQLLSRRFELPSHPAFHRGRSGWRPGEGKIGPRPKRPVLYGPAKQAMMRPFVLVYGTQQPSVADFLKHTANQEAVRWWLIANGTTQVLSDTEVTDAVIASRNLVLYGGPKENQVSGRIAAGLPMQSRNGRLFLDGRDLGDGLAAVFVYPNPLNPDRLVLVRMGTDDEHTRLSCFWSLVASSTGIPDFIIFDRRVRRYGWAGVRAAGFFDPNWNLDPGSTFFER